MASTAAGICDGRAALLLGLILFGMILLKLLSVIFNGFFRKPTRQETNAVHLPLKIEDDDFSQEGKERIGTEEESGAGKKSIGSYKSVKEELD